MHERSPQNGRKSMPAPKTRRVAGVLATLGCVVLSGCQQAPTAPARAQAQTTHIGGQVTDALLRGLSEALVEVLDGPDAGKRFVADADGRFAATSTARANSSVTLRASKDGYRSTTVATTWVPLDALAHVLVRMPGFEPYDALGSGEYTITIAIDLESARSRLPAGPCPGYPVELYPAPTTRGLRKGRLAGAKSTPRARPSRESRASRCSSKVTAR